MFDAESAGFVLDFCEVLQNTQGNPLVLMDWQREVITEFYGTLMQDEDGGYIRQYQYLYLEIPKKNGKSEISGALGLYHLCGDCETNGEVYVVAADKENAGIVFGAAKHMVETNPTLKKDLRVVDSIKTIFDPMTGSKMKVLSSEAYSKHGYKPSCVIFDELHAQRDRKLWDVMTFGAGDARRQPVWIVLTTAGDDPDRKSIGWEVHQKALAILRYRAGGRNERDYDDPAWLPIVYGLGLIEDDDELKEIDIYDEALWKKCNPSIGKTIKMRTVRAEAREAKRSESAERLFRWLRLNQWIATKAVGWIPLTIYDKTQWNENKERLLGLTCYGGVDLSSTTDLTSFVLLFPPQKGLDTWVAVPFGWVPTDDIEAREKRDHVPYRDWIRAKFLRGCAGDIIDYEDVTDVIVQAAEDYNLEMVGFDPYLSRTITQRLETMLAPYGTDIVEIPQTVRQLSPAMKDMEELIRKHQMLHVHNTAARWNFGNVKCYVDGNGNLKPMKQQSMGRIDMTVAWIIAMATAKIAMENKEASLAEQVANGEWSM